MPPPVSRRLRRPSIIAALLVVALTLSGCGMVVKIGYGQGSPIAFRWLDSYVDFNDAQSLRVRTALDDWFAWHRRTQLSDYADLLARAQLELAAPATSEQMCGWARDIRARIDTGFERAEPVLAEVLPTLTPQQISNIEKKFAEKNDEYRDNFLAREPARRRKAAIKREVERAEMFYGRLDDVQLAYVVRAVARSPFDGELAYSERLRRQQDMLAMIRRLAAKRATPVEADAEIRAYVQRLDRSPRENYRRYTETLVQYNCTYAAALHNLATAEQRQNAARKLKDYEDELRSLAADAS